ncbi:HlyD family type I secretion periplasmic adaptor subunit [Rhodoblastus sp.]|uniref:HlyD family type I secretion periplasmic adaptor subunit n=1 Tax=Rhodoblastus sp. TaxID=1962975 RepID=UPI003F9B99E6
MTAMTKKQSNRSPSEWRPIAVAGYTLIAMTFGVAGVWAAVAKLDKAVIATGFVETETNRKTVEHLEGGIVRGILVKEGDHVAEGQLLFRLEQVQAEANNVSLKNQLDSALALEARLIAERDGAQEISWPKELKDGPATSTLSHTLDDQIHQFEERRRSLEGQKNILQSRIAQLNTEIDGISIEKSSTEKQTAYINEELVGLRELAGKNLVPVTRVYAMERERTRLEGDVGRAVADVAKAQSSIGEMNIQIQELTQKFQEDVASSLLDARQKIADLRERSSVAQDVLNRLAITAPRAGMVQNLKVFTIGQVLRSGEPLLDIAPDNDALVVHAQFPTADIDTVFAGMTAEIRFPAFHSRTIPVMLGKIESISHDRLLDDPTHQYYYLGVVSLNRADIPEEYRSRVRAGMPAEVIVSSGERTVLNYLVGPLSSSLRRTFREQQE